MYQYSFANVDLNITIPDFAGNDDVVTITGFPTGENLISAARRAPIATTTFGAYGKMIVNMHRIVAGDLSFPLLAGSDDNVKLQKWANNFQAQANSSTVALVPPLQASITDNMGNDKVTMTNGVVLAIPALVRGQTMNTVNWVISFEEMTFAREKGLGEYN